MLQYELQAKENLRNSATGSSFRLINHETSVYLTTIRTNLQTMTSSVVNGIRSSH